MQWFCFGYGQGQTSHQRNLLGFILIIPPNGYFVMFPDNFANQAVHFIGLSISEGENISLVQQICFTGTKPSKKKIKYSVGNGNRCDERMKDANAVVTLPEKWTEKIQVLNGIRTHEISNLNLTSYRDSIIGANTFINLSKIILCIKQF